MVKEFWKWECDPEPDAKHGIALIPIPPHARNFFPMHRDLEITTSTGEVKRGQIIEHNRIAWVARVRVS